MFFQHDLIEEIKFKHTKDVSKYASPHDLVYDEIIGDAITFEDEAMEVEVSAGRIKAYCFNLIDFNDSVHDLLDPISAATAEFIPFFNDEGEIDKKVFETLNIEFNEDNKLSCSNAFIIFDILDVKKEYRGKGIGKLLIQTTCHDYRREARFAFLKAFPLQYEGVDTWTPEIKKSKEKEIKEFKERNLDQSTNKLLNLYKSCGFKLIEGTKDFMVTDLWNYHS